MRITDNSVGVVVIKKDLIETNRHIVYNFECETTMEVLQIQTFIKTLLNLNIPK
jgi:hypothetical protein